MGSHTSQIKEVLKQEAAAINQAAERLYTEQVEQAVELLVNCRGQVVLAGVGKSGFIARKIAATLTSMGTRSVFLHPSDALHGDLASCALKMWWRW